MIRKRMVLVHMQISTDAPESIFSYYYRDKKNTCLWLVKSSLVQISIEPSTFSCRMITNSVLSQYISQVTFQSVIDTQKKHVNITLSADDDGDIDETQKAHSFSRGPGVLCACLRGILACQMRCSIN